MLINLMRPGVCVNQAASVSLYSTPHLVSKKTIRTPLWMVMEQCCLMKIQLRAESGCTLRREKKVVFEHCFSLSKMRLENQSSLQYLLFPHHLTVTSMTQDSAAEFISLTICAKLLVIYLVCFN